MAIALQHLAASDFHAQVGKDFFIHFAKEAIISAQLKNVLDLPASNNLVRKPFSILLQTDQKNHYQQAIYTIEQSDLGTMQIFLVPVGCSDKGMQYEAVFS